MSSAKHWVFTLNNYTEQELEQINKLHEQKQVTYLIYGKETGTNGTPHLQGYLQLTKKNRAPHVKTLLGSRAHIEKAKGSPSQNRTYCTKDGEYREFGSCPKPRGNRSDIEGLVQAIKGGASHSEIRDQFPQLYLRYPKAINEWINDLAPARFWETEVIVHTGNTGTGKTRSVYEFIKHDEIWSYPGGGWFDGYSGQKVALFDDFDSKDLGIEYLLKLLDRYPMRVPVKGNFTNWTPRHIFITSNATPDEWYPHAIEKHRNALKRRITLIKKF